MNVMPDFLEDAIDLHVHSAPDVDRRRYNDLDLAREAERAAWAQSSSSLIRTPRWSAPGWCRR